METKTLVDNYCKKRNITDTNTIEEVRTKFARKMAYHNIHECKSIIHDVIEFIFPIIEKNAIVERFRLQRLYYQQLVINNRTRLYIRQLWDFAPISRNPQLFVERLQPDSYKHNYNMNGA
jgi:hypothetical protein